VTSHNHRPLLLSRPLLYVFRFTSTILSPLLFIEIPPPQTPCVEARNYRLQSLHTLPASREELSLPPVSPTRAAPDVSRIVFQPTRLTHLVFDPPPFVAPGFVFSCPESDHSFPPENRFLRIQSPRSACTDLDFPWTRCWLVSLPTLGFPVSVHSIPPLSRS